VTCSRCGQPLGLITYTIEAWVGDRSVAQSTLCPVCAGVHLSPANTPEHYQLELTP